MTPHSSDEPLRYSRERAIIWSAGPDGKDDGGREADPEELRGPVGPRLEAGGAVEG